VYFGAPYAFLMKFSYLSKKSVYFISHLYCYTYLINQSRVYGFAIFSYSFFIIRFIQKIYDYLLIGIVANLRLVYCLVLHN
jgi:hypothetical protein